MSKATLTPTELVTLAVLADRARYGYAIVQEVTRRSGGTINVRPGNLYRIIDRLVERGLVASAPTPDDDPATDDRRQYYEATDSGRQVAADQLSMYADLLAASDVLKNVVGS